MGKFFLLAVLISSHLNLFSEEENPPLLDPSMSVQESSDLVGWNRQAPLNFKKSTKNEPADLPIAECCVPASPPPEVCNPCCKDALCGNVSSHMQIGANYTYAHVKPSGQPSTSGSLGGIQALYEFKTLDRVYGGVAFAWRQGDTDGSGTDRSIQEFDVQERLGYTWGNCDACDNEIQWMLSLFSGFGYRHYGEKVSSTGSSITCNYNEFYFPVGFLLEGKVYSILSMGLNFQWMPQAFSTVGIVPLKGSRWDLDNKLNNFRVELPFTFVVSKCHHLSLVFQPFFEYWRDGHTSAKTQLGTSLNIPGNTYLFGGADLNLRYSF